MELPRRRLLPRIVLKRRVLKRRVLKRLWKLPQIVLPQIVLPQIELPRVDLPRVLIDFPEELLVPWDQMEIERIEVVPLKPRDLKIIFRKIPVDERQIKQEATP